MEGYTLAAMLYISAQTALLASIRYWLYQDNLRVSARRMYVVLFVIALGGALLWCGTGGIPGVTFYTFRIILALVMFGISCYIIQVPLAKHTYIYSFIVVYDSTIEATATFVQLGLAAGPRGWAFVLAAVLLLSVSFVPAVRCIKWMIERLSSAGNDKVWNWLCVISFSFVFMNLLFTFPPSPDAPVRDLLSRYLMLFGVAGLYAATTRTIVTMREASEAKAERDLADRRIAIQQSYYDRMVAQMDEVRRQRHDLRHHRAALAALIQCGDLAALSEYMDSTAEIGEAVPLTGHLTVDSVLLYYMDTARALGVRTETELFIGRKTPLSDSDLCVILGNLLENAVDAQRHLPAEKRYIRIAAKGDEAHLTLVVDNHFDGLLHMEDGVYRSRKEGAGHGVGLSSVGAVCKKYGGVLQLEAEGETFMAGVVIGL